MIPYNFCEWKYITYGKKKMNKLKKYKSLILMSMIPSITLIWILLLILQQ